MSQFAKVLAVLLALPLLAAGNDPPFDPVEAGLKLQKSIVAAEGFLTANMPSEAVAVLEAELANADGNRGFLALLQRAYLAEIQRLEGKPNTDANHLAQTKRKLSLLGELPANTITALPANTASPALPGEPLLAARSCFNQGKYAEAAEGFALASRQKAALTESDATGWAYCRIKLAADRVNAPQCDAAVASAAEQEVTAAMQMAPNHANLQKVGRSVIAVARQKGAAMNTNRPNPPTATPNNEWQTIETASFRVRFQGSREQAEAVAKAAEEKRQTIFERWSGSPGGAWEPRCEIVLHPTATCYAKMTGQPAHATGHALVKLIAGRATERRIELRADDAGLVCNSLPREMTHIVLADLFPNTPPPKWAEEGMAVLAGDPDEVKRFTRKLTDCHREGQLYQLTALMELATFPDANRITGFYCESVSVVEYLVSVGGERNFTIFIRDCQRYGTASALKRNYNIESPQALEQAWKQSALTTSRGQQP